MKQFLVMKLQGPMQAWGGHTYEDLRHSELIPTRSGILGLLAACLGIDRNNVSDLQALSSGLAIAVRIDPHKDKRIKMRRITDFHTVMDARKVDGSRNKYPVVSHREYLCDVCFTVVLQEKGNVVFDLEKIARAMQKPVYTPFLGRRACPISRPLYEDLLSANDWISAFSMVAPRKGVIYSEASLSDKDIAMRLRDEPIYVRQRQFASRTLFIHAPSEEQGHVSE